MTDQRLGFDDGAQQRAISLRPYQQEAVDGLREAFRRGAKNVVLSLPTGAGKTRIAAAIIDAAARKGGAVHVMVERLTLLDQWRQALGDLGIDAGYRQAENDVYGEDPVTIWMQQTCTARDEWPESGLLIVDEAHVTCNGGKGRVWLRDGWRGRTVGLTATPSVPGVQGTYDALVAGPTTDELRAEGHLLDLDVLIATPMAMEGHAKNSRGEWREEDMDAELKQIVGDLPTHWLDQCMERWDGIRSTIVFSPSVSSGVVLTEQFNKLLADVDPYRFAPGGIDHPGALQVQGGDPGEHRRECIRRFKAGSAVVLVNVAVIGRGADFPNASVMIDAHPFAKAHHEYMQRLGRILRPGGADRATVIDHTGNWERFLGQTATFLHRRPTHAGLPPDKPEKEDPEILLRLCTRCADGGECVAGCCTSWTPAGRPCQCCGEEPGIGLADTAHGWRCSACGWGNKSDSGGGSARPKCASCGKERAQAGDGGDGDGGGDGVGGWDCPECGRTNARQAPRCASAGCPGVKEERFEEVEGKIVEWRPDKPFGVDDAIDLNRPSRYLLAHVHELALRHYMAKGGALTAGKRAKAAKYAGVIHREITGAWPPWGWQEAPPAREPEIDPRLTAWKERRDADFKAKAPWRR